jgi:hypothetical protein
LAFAPSLILELKRTLPGDELKPAVKILSNRLPALDEIVEAQFPRLALFRSVRPYGTDLAARADELEV